MAVIDLAGVSQQTLTGNWVLKAISYTINLRSGLIGALSNSAFRQGEILQLYTKPPELDVELLSKVTPMS